MTSVTQTCGAGGRPWLSGFCCCLDDEVTDAVFLSDQHAFYSMSSFVLANCDIPAFR